jgi:hypothetical protein
MKICYTEDIICWTLTGLSLKIYWTVTGYVLDILWILPDSTGFPVDSAGLSPDID